MIRFSGISDGMRVYEVTFRCIKCQDTGFVSVWKPSTLTQARKDPDTTSWRTCAALCTCEAAERKGNEFRSGRSVPVFGSQDWHICASLRDSKAAAAVWEPNVVEEWTPQP